MPPDPVVLAFDTSAAHCAAALLCGEVVLAERVEDMATGQADRLMPMLEEMLSGAGIGWRDLACIGVGTGPGNFTGVRISVAAARGLALGLGVPAVGVTALEALAHGRDGLRLVTLDARRGAVYAQVFGGAAQAGRADICTLDTLPEAAGAVCIGHLAEDVAALVGGQAAEPAMPPTVAMARIALAMVLRARVLTADHRATIPRPAPFYLRGADAAPPSDPPPVILP